MDEKIKDYDKKINDNDEVLRFKYDMEKISKLMASYYLLSYTYIFLYYLVLMVSNSYLPYGKYNYD